MEAEAPLSKGRIGESAAGRKSELAQIPRTSKTAMPRAGQFGVAHGPGAGAGPLPGGGEGCADSACLVKERPALPATSEMGAGLQRRLQPGRWLRLLRIRARGAAARSQPVGHAHKFRAYSRFAERVTGP